MKKQHASQELHLRFVRLLLHGRINRVFVPYWSYFVFCHSCSHQAWFFLSKLCHHQTFTKDAFPKAKRSLKKLLDLNSCHQTYKENTAQGSSSPQRATSYWLNPRLSLWVSFQQDETKRSKFKKTIRTDSHFPLQKGDHSLPPSSIWAVNSWNTNWLLWNLFSQASPHKPHGTSVEGGRTLKLGSESPAMTACPPSSKARTWSAQNWETHPGMNSAFQGEPKHRCSKSKGPPKPL